MKMKIAGIVPESIVDGEGLRFVIFVQGCHHHCPGCHNPETWDFNNGIEMSTQEIEARFLSNKLIKGITLSGGEPFGQPLACSVLAKTAKDHGLTVWCYTGYVYETLVSLNDPQVNDLLAHIDVLVDGPYKKELRDLSLDWRGSSNQRVIRLKLKKKRIKRS